MIQHKIRALILFSAIYLTLAPTIASADDFAPPPWPRTDPHAVTAEWEFFTPTNPLPPDGPLTNVFTKGSGSAPGGTLATISGPGLGWGPGDGDGGWFFPAGGDILFRMDNIIDLEPVKHIRMQVTHTPGLGLGVDPLVAFNIGATGATPSSVTMIPSGATHTIFTWDMFPNPPWEDFRLFVGSGGGEIDEVVIDTISIPEPAAFVLCGISLLYLGSGIRRRHTRTLPS